MARVIRPSWAEFMDMDMTMAAAVYPNLPGLNDGSGEYVKALFSALANRR